MCFSLHRTPEPDPFNCRVPRVRPFRVRFSSVAVGGCHRFPRCEEGIDECRCLTVRAAWKRKQAIRIMYCIGVRQCTNKHCQRSWREESSKRWLFWLQTLLSLAACTQVKPCAVTNEQVGEPQSVFHRQWWISEQGRSLRHAADVPESQTADR